MALGGLSAYTGVPFEGGQHTAVCEGLDGGARS
jgi:hypothetical protein